MEVKSVCHVNPPSGQGPIPPEDPAESDHYHASGKYTGYKTPYPLSEEDFLVSARGQGNRFRLYLMDVHGNREVIYEGAHNVLHAIPVKRRPVPQAAPIRSSPTAPRPGGSTAC